MTEEERDEALLRPVLAYADRYYNDRMCCNCVDCPSMALKDKPPVSETILGGIGDMPVNCSILYGYCTRHTRNVVADGHCGWFTPKPASGPSRK